jgi:hypothetical protein
MCNFDQKKRKVVLYVFRPKKDKTRRAPQFPEPPPDRSGI